LRTVSDAIEFTYTSALREILMKRIGGKQAAHSGIVVDEELAVDALRLNPADFMLSNDPLRTSVFKRYKIFGFVLFR